MVAVWFVLSAGSTSLFFPPLATILERFGEVWIGQGFVEHVLPSLGRMLAGYLMVYVFSGGFLFYLLIFFFSGAIGSFIGRLTKRAVGGRRGRYLPGLVVAMMILGVLIPALPLLLVGALGNPGALASLIGPGIYLFVASSAAYWQMR